MARLVFIGTGEAFDPELPNTSLLYRGSITLLLDCGYSVPQAFWRWVQDPDLVDAIYLSHRHADHSFGLPALLLWMKQGGRTRPLILLGGPGLEPWVSDLLELGYPGAYRDVRFAIEYRPLQPGRQLRLGELIVDTAPTEHGVPNTAVALSEGGHRVCFSGDGAPTAESLALYRGSSLVVHECFSASSSPPGHASAGALLELADQLELRTLALVHVSRQERTRVKEVVRAAESRCRVLLPEVGHTIELVSGEQS